MTIIRVFTVPQNNAFALQNLLELWRDARFQDVLRQVNLPDTPQLILPPVMVLLMHLTYHEDVVVKIWANQDVRSTLLSAARLLDRTARGGIQAVEEPGRASARLEAFTALHNLTCVPENLAPLWADADLQLVVVAAAASTHKEDRRYREMSLKMLSNFLLESANLDSMKQHAEACAALEAAAKTIKSKKLVRVVNSALEQLGHSTQQSPLGQHVAEQKGAPEGAPEEAVAVEVVAPGAEAPEADAGWAELLEGFEQLLPEESVDDPIHWIEASAKVRKLTNLLTAQAQDETQHQQPPQAQAKLMQALLENGWWLANQSKGTALERMWQQLARTITFSVRSIAEARPCAFFYDLRCRDHLCDVASDDNNVLDKPQRVQRALDAAKRVRGRLTMVELTEADDDKMFELARLAHTDKYVVRQLKVLEQAEGGSKHLVASVLSGAGSHEGDTMAATGTRQAVVSSLSCVLRCVDAVLDGEAHLPFCCVRPPGHHVGRDGRTHDAPSQGFCFFNNVAIAAKYAVDKKGLSRVAVIDFDVHHGNGTEEILSSDSRFFFVSVHAFAFASFYPHTGSESLPQRNVVNVALRKGFTFADLLQGWRDDEVNQKLIDFQPQLIILSSGFDAHKTDLAKAAKLDAGDYFELTQQLISLAWCIESCHGRLLSVLEGGYDCKVGGGLQNSIQEHLQALAGAPRQPYAPREGAKRGREGAATVT